MNHSDQANTVHTTQEIDENNAAAVSQSPAGQVKRKTNTSKMLVDLVVCILIPTLILKKLSAPELLGSNLALMAALSLPLGVALYEFFTVRKIGFVAALGFISILLTGGIGLLKLPSEYIAIKEALIPAVLALATLISTYTKYPLIRTFLYNDMVMDTDKVARRLQQANRQTSFDRMMVRATWMLAGSFVLSAVLNFALAKWIVISPTGTEAFNNELGTMNLMSYPVIVVPCMVVTIFTLFYVIRNISKLTGLTLEEMVHQ